MSIQLALSCNLMSCFSYLSTFCIHSSHVFILGKAKKLLPLPPSFFQPLHNTPLLGTNTHSGGIMHIANYDVTEMETPEGNEEATALFLAKRRQSHEQKNMSFGCKTHDCQNIWSCDFCTYPFMNVQLYSQRILPVCVLTFR